jgi:hypothetical protein
LFCLFFADQKERVLSANQYLAQLVSKAVVPFVLQVGVAGISNSWFYPELFYGYNYFVFIKISKGVSQLFGLYF